MADVQASLKDWSTTASSNSPTDSTTIGAGLADNLQQIQATVRQDLASKGADIASASTTDLGAVAGLMHDITGTTTITSFGTVAAGIWKLIKFEGALTLTHNATSLILPGGANITTADGDTALMFSEGSGNWRCLNYQKASGSNVIGQGAASAVGRNFAGRTNSSNPNYQVDFTASELSVKTSANASLTLYTVSVTADITASGANGLDTGSDAGDTWYYLYVIYNPSTATVASLLSASATSPTLPSGYTYFALVGAVRNDGSSNFIKYQQNGADVSYEALNSVLTGGSATTETQITISSFVPSIAQKFRTFSTGSITADGSGNALGTLSLRWVSGTNFITNSAALYGLANGSAGNFLFTGVENTIPNRSLALYYLWGGITGSAQSANVFVVGFTIPGGGA